jgi:hypothetical protein
MKRIARSTFLFIIIIILLSGCTSLTSESFNDLGKGMTENEVIDVLGNPSQKITKQTEVSELIQKELKSTSQILAMTDEGSEEYENFYKDALEIGEAKTLVDEGYSVTVYQYKYKYEDIDGKTAKAERPLFFYGGKLIYK